MWLQMPNCYPGSDPMFEVFKGDLGSVQGQIHEYIEAIGLNNNKVQCFNLITGLSTLNEWMNEWFDELMIGWLRNWLSSRMANWHIK